MIMKVNLQDESVDTQGGYIALICQYDVSLVYCFICLCFTVIGKGRGQQRPSDDSIIYS